jgi:repressor of nif and glnA expression
MSLKDEVLRASVRKLSMEHILESLDEEDRDDLVELLSGEAVDASTIALVLRKRGFDISDRTVQRYRKTLGELNG